MGTKEEALGVPSGLQGRPGISETQSRDPELCGSLERHERMPTLVREQKAAASSLDNMSQMSLVCKNIAQGTGRRALPTSQVQGEHSGGCASGTCTWSTWPAQRRFFLERPGDPATDSAKAGGSELGGSSFRTSVLFWPLVIISHHSSCDFMGLLIRFRSLACWLWGQLPSAAWCDHAVLHPAAATLQTSWGFGGTY